MSTKPFANQSRLFGLFEKSDMLAALYPLPLLQTFELQAPSANSRILENREIPYFQRTVADNPWFTSDGLSEDAHSLIRAVRSARIHALNPQAYYLDQINSAVATYVTNRIDWHTYSQKKYSQLSQNQRVDPQLSMLLDDSFLKLVKDLGEGVIHGPDVQKRLFRQPPEVDAKKLLRSVKRHELSVQQVLVSVTPSDPGYQRLTQTLQKLLGERAVGVSRTRINSVEDALSGNQIHDDTLLWTRLIETGDLTSSYPNTTLTYGLKAFQARHGLEQSGQANEQTRLALNADVDDEIDAVSMSLERYRWLPRNLGRRHVMVNIPDFSVKLIDDNKTTLTMKSVVGRYWNQTPSFSKDMKYMEFNPTWTVPERITRNELIPKERLRPGYLVSQNFEFLKYVGQALVRIPADQVTSDDFNAARFPYLLRQRGGSDNVLGALKFMMPNKYAIYLHDTPYQSHFARTQRAYSHGCVRVADPVALAQALMLGDGYSQSAVDKSLRSTQTHRIKLRQHVPTHLVYLTTWVDENQVLQTRPDVYDNDVQLLDALRKSNTLIGTMNSRLLAQVDMAP